MDHTESMALDRAYAAAGFVKREGRWGLSIPARFNIGLDTVARHAVGPRAGHPALLYEREDGSVATLSFAELDAQSNRLASRLADLGVVAGQPVGVHLDQRPETALVHLALYKVGAIACTMSQLYGPDTLRHVLADTGLRLVFTRTPNDALQAAVAALVAGGADPPRLVHCGEEFDAILREGDAAFVPAGTAADDPALLMYTSGSTGLPKGMLHAHRILAAYLPTVRLFYDLAMDAPDAVFWTPADWAWVGGLLDLVLPAWAHGQTVLAWSGRFDAKAAFALMERHRVTHSFMTPTALKRLAEVRTPRTAFPGLRLAHVCTGGEALPGEVVRWAEQGLGAVCNEFYGLTEFNHLVGNCRAAYPIVPGSMGRAYPGRDVRLVDENGSEVAPGEIGEIVSTPDDPTLFLGYWGVPGIPDSLRLGEHLRTRDLARRDAQGYIWYEGRNDDLIKSAGYRIGPAEIEDALLKHPAVAEAAVVASPDAERGSVVKAFVRLREGHSGSAALVRELQQMVKRDLAAYKYPREIEFVDAFPMTSSGKIRRGELRRREAEAKAALAGRTAG
ncbi:MAG: AMP-binding protein [Casimicrobiaceae bacterium]